MFSSALQRGFSTGLQPSKLFFLLVLILVPAAALAQPSAREARPNVIVILADDLGYECIGANGGKSYKTPNIDRLAAGGVRFEHCYAQPNCTPSRAQLMTGMYNVRNYVEFGLLEKSQTTFAHLFSRAGYATCIAGKWQLGSKDPDLPKHFGFDEHCLWAHMGRGERYANPSLTINGEFKTLDGKYGPDICQEFVTDFIRRNRERPFLLYYPMILTHGPYEPTPDSADYGEPRDRKRDDSKQRHFTEMVAYMDKLVGDLDRFLEEQGLRQNTLLLFTGDNGTGRGVVSELEGGGERSGEKGSTTRAGMHVPLIASWPGKIKSGAVCADLVDMTDFLPTICEAAGVKPPAELTLDGRSFWPQLSGRSANPREWIYSFWVPLRDAKKHRVGERGAVEQVFDKQYKLYSTGEFFDLNVDPEEQDPKAVADLTGGEADAARKLRLALDQFQKIKPLYGSP